MSANWTLVIVTVIALYELVAGAIVKVEESELSRVPDVLASIEARLSAMHEAMTSGQCAAGQRVVQQRMDAFEAKLSRIEDKLEEHLSKLRQGEIAKEVLHQEPSSLELSKKMDSTAEKLFARLGIFEAKSNIQMAGVGVKIQRMERHLGRSMDDAMDKILKIEEKNTQMMENLWTSGRIGGGEFDPERKELNPVKFRVRNVQLDDERVMVDKVATASDNNVPPCQASSLLHNLSNTLTEAMLINEKKVAELDSDVEIYTRKVLNAYQELSEEHEAMETRFDQVVGQGNNTHEMIRDGFRRIVQLMKPINAFDDVLQSLHKKVSKFENTIDASFATLLVAQNMFIGLLQRLVTKMDEKPTLGAVPLHSSSDILWTALESHRKDVGQALHDLVWTVIKVGNDTVEEISRTFGQLQPQQRQCPCRSNSSNGISSEDPETGRVEGPSEGSELNIMTTTTYEREEDEEVQEEEERDAEHDDRVKINTPIPSWKITGPNN